MDIQDVTARPRPLAEKCADELEAAILSGEFLPGQRLDEVALGARFEVSRNTLREAFRLLAMQELAQHVPNRGVFVAVVDAELTKAVYAVRRHLELGALDDLASSATARGNGPDPEALAEMAAAVAEAERARDEDDWAGVGTANAHFHLAVVRLGANPVSMRFMRILIAQTRLRLLTVGDPRMVHQSFLDDNRRVCELVREGHYGRARTVLELYLLRAEEEFA